jgi:hypothetical protein
MADPLVLARSLALDVMREHLPLIERAMTVAQARAGMEATIEQARRVLVQSTGQTDTSALDRAVDELLARLVVMQRPRIDRFGGLHDAGHGGGGRTGLVLAVVLLVIAGLGAVGWWLARAS